MNSYHDLEGNLVVDPWDEYCYEVTIDIHWEVHDEGFSYEFWGEIGYHQIWVPTIEDYVVEEFSIYDAKTDSYVEITPDNEQLWLDRIYDAIDEEVYEMEPPYV